MSTAEAPRPPTFDGLPRVLVVGESVMDVVLGDAPVRVPGGSPANVALGLARLQVTTQLLSYLGHDADGTAIARHLRSAGVDLLAESFVADRTPTATVSLDAVGAPAYAFDVGWRPQLPAGELAFSALHLGSYSAFVPDGVEVVDALFAQARRDASLISLDPNIRPELLPPRDTVVARFEELASLATIVKLSDEDAAWLYPEEPAEEAIDRLLGLGTQLVVLTRGAAGSIVATARARATAAALRTAMIDSVGAGDAYMAALVQSVVHTGVANLGARGLEWIARRCSAAAAITVGRRGADPPWDSELDVVARRLGA